MKRIQDVSDLEGKRVLVRVGYDVPLKDGKVSDIERIEASLKTINYLIEKGAAVALCAHLGRPGKPLKEFSLFPVVGPLARLLEKPVRFLSECVGTEVQQVVSNLSNGDVLVLENLRFHEGEEKNDPDFAKALATGFDLYINEAFSNSHRSHASMVGVADYLPAYAGFELQEEVENLKELTENPKKPFVMVSGGAKISDKIEILKSLIPKIDVLLVGGGMANTFLASEGYEVGKSLYEEDYLGAAEEIMRDAEELGVEVMLPDDVIVAKKVGENQVATERSLDEIEKSDIIVDIGPKSVAKFSEPLKFAGTIFWNGPVGIAEYKNFAKGTTGLAKIISESEARSVIGGGDTLGAVSVFQLPFGFVSTAGGATLEYLAKGALPALEVL